MRILVLGSSGLIGKSLVKLLRIEKFEVYEWDILLDVKHDLSNPLNFTRLTSAVDRCDFVFFLAYDVGGAKYIKIPTGDFLNRNMLIR